MDLGLGLKKTAVQNAKIIAKSSACPPKAYPEAAGMDEVPSSDLCRSHLSGSFPLAASERAVQLAVLQKSVMGIDSNELAVVHDGNAIREF